MRDVREEEEEEEDEKKISRLTHDLSAREKVTRGTTGV